MLIFSSKILIKLRKSISKVHSVSAIEKILTVSTNNLSATWQKNWNQRLFITIGHLQKSLKYSTSKMFSSNTYIKFNSPTWLLDWTIKSNANYRSSRRRYSTVDKLLESCTNLFSIRCASSSIIILISFLNIVDSVAHVSKLIS